MFFFMGADPWHAEMIGKQLQLENCAPSSAPNERINPKHLIEEDLQELSKDDASAYRAVAARGNYLSIDRSDLIYAVKELARRMVKPRNIDLKQLVQFGRYLTGKMRVFNKCTYQRNFKIIDVWSYTNHAGCSETCKSATGGVIMLGSHVINHWPSTQSIISLSSGEAE